MGAVQWEIVAAGLAALICAGAQWIDQSRFSFGLSIAAGSIVALLIEGVWQGVAFLQTGTFPTHSLAQITNPPNSTSWVGFDWIVAQIRNAPVHFLYGVALFVGIGIAKLEGDDF